MSDRPELVGWFVIEVDVKADRDEPVHAFMSGPFPTEEKAQREVDQRREAWEDALDDWDDGSPYDHKKFQVTQHKMSDSQLGRLEREDRESYEIRMEAVNAVGASLLADEGIGPLAENTPNRTGDANE